MTDLVPLFNCTHPNKVPAYLKDHLNKAYDVFLRTEPENKYATAEDGRWHLPQTPQSA